MAWGDPDPERRWPDSELQRRAGVHCLAVDPGVQRCRGMHLQPGRGPGSPWRVRAAAGWVGDGDAGLAAVQGGAGAAGQRAIERAGVVRHEHDGEMMVLAPLAAGQVLGWGEDDGLDLLCVRLPGHPGACGLAATGPRAGEQHGLARRAGGPAAMT